MFTFCPKIQLNECFFSILNKAFWSLSLAICFTSCIILPVPTKPRIIEGKVFTDSTLEFANGENVTKQDILEKLGPATLWLEPQHTLVYGLRKVKSTGTMLIAGGYYSGNITTIKSEAREAVYFVLDDNEKIKLWGRAPVGKNQTWLSGASEWAKSKGIDLPKPNSTFEEDSPNQEQCYIYFYRPRDYQYYFPSAKPGKKLPGGVANFVNISLPYELVGQLHWQTYIKVRVAPGTHTFTVDPDTDYIVNENLYTNETISVSVEPGSVAFIEVGVESGLGTIKPKLSQRTRDEAIDLIKDLKESW